MAQAADAVDDRLPPREGGGDRERRGDVGRVLSVDLDAAQRLVGPDDGQPVAAESEPCAHGAEPVGKGEVALKRGAAEALDGADGLGDQCGGGKEVRRAGGIGLDGVLTRSIPARLNAEALRRDLDSGPEALHQRERHRDVGPGGNRPREHERQPVAQVRGDQEQAGEELAGGQAGGDIDLSAPEIAAPDAHRQRVIGCIDFGADGAEHGEQFGHGPLPQSRRAVEGDPVRGERGQRG